MFKKIVLIFALVLLPIMLVGVFRYSQSDQLAQTAKVLLEQGRVGESISLYTQAVNIFPFRKDLQDSLDGARLIQESDLQFNDITEVRGELQDLPPISALPIKVEVREGQLFVPILMYHHIRVNPRPLSTEWAILNVTPAQLDSQLNYLVNNNYHTISLEELHQALNSDYKLPENPVVLTFDDGYRNFYESAFPLLKKYHLKATSFVITQGVGAIAYLTWDQIKEMDKSGLVEFGGHTRHHPSLPSLSPILAIDEIKGSKSDLEEHLGKRIDFFAYPYGSYNDFVIKVVKDAGFLGATSTIYGGLQGKENEYLMQRIAVDGRAGLDAFAARLKK